MGTRLHTLCRSFCWGHGVPKTPFIWGVGAGWDLVRLAREDTNSLKQGSCQEIPEMPRGEQGPLRRLTLTCFRRFLGLTQRLMLPQREGREEPLKLTSGRLQQGWETRRWSWCLQLKHPMWGTNKEPTKANKQRLKGHMEVAFYSQSEEGDLTELSLGPRVGTILPLEQWKDGGTL